MPGGGGSLESRDEFAELSSVGLPSAPVELMTLEQVDAEMTSRMKSLSCAPSEASSGDRAVVVAPQCLQNQHQDLLELLRVGEKLGWPGRKRFKPGSIIHAALLDKPSLELLENTTFFPLLKRIGIKVVASKDPDIWHVIDIEMSDDKQDQIKHKIEAYWQEEEDDDWELTQFPSMVEIVIYNGTKLEATEENAAHVHSKFMHVLAKMRHEAGIEVSPEIKKPLDHHDLLERAREVCDKWSDVLSSCSGSSPSTLSEVRRNFNRCYYAASLGGVSVDLPLFEEAEMVVHPNHIGSHRLVRTPAA